MVDSLAGGAVSARVVPVLARVQALVSGAHLVGLALGVGGAPGLAQPVDTDPPFAALVAAAADASATAVGPTDFVGQAVGFGRRALGHAETGVAGGGGAALGVTAALLRRHLAPDPWVTLQPWRA